MLQVKARVLPPPTVSYGGNSMVQPDGGAWNLISTAFYEPRHLSDWAIVALTDRGRLVNPRDGEEASLNSFLNDFKQVRSRHAPPGPARRSEDRSFRARVRIITTNATTRGSTPKRRDSCAGGTGPVFVSVSPCTALFSPIHKSWIIPG